MAEWADLVGPAHGRVVSFRADSLGGSARRSPLLGEGFSRRRRLILLVHGFNVNEVEAYDAYRAFEHNLAEELGPTRWESIRDDVLWLLWPGDARVLEGFRPLAIAKPGIYGPRVAHVQQWAPHFAEWLARQRGPTGSACELVFVGHSLGCRLILEALLSYAGLSPAPQNTVPLLMLMAAAVPVVHVEQEGRLRTAVEFAKRRDVLHSTRDDVLQIAFRAGQHFGEAFVGGIAPEAVGTHGNPGPPIWTSSKPMGVGHGGYWGNPVVARRLLHQLSMLTTPVARERPKQERPAVRPWRLPSARGLLQHWRRARQ